jgi:hypothetical protein
MLPCARSGEAFDRGRIPEREELAREPRRTRSGYAVWILPFDDDNCHGVFREGITANLGGAAARLDRARCGYYARKRIDDRPVVRK